MGSATQIAKEIRAAIRAETGLTASAGVSCNKSSPNWPLMKTSPTGCSDYAGDGSRFHRDAACRQAVVGPATTAKMNRLGIHNGLDLRACDLPFLSEAFGKAGRFYYWIARGVDEHRSGLTAFESPSARRPPFEDLTSFEALRDVLADLAAKVWRHCEAAQMRGRTVTLKVKYLDFKPSPAAGRSPRPSLALRNRRGQHRSLARLIPSKGIRLLGITVSNLEAEGETRPSHQQMSLALFAGDHDP